MIGKRVVSRSSAIVGNGECDHGNRRPSQEIASRHWLVMPTDSGFHARRSIERSATPAIQDLRRFLASCAPWAFVSQSQQLGQVSAFHGGRAPIQSLAPCPLIRRAIAEGRRLAQNDVKWFWQYGNQLCRSVSEVPCQGAMQNEGARHDQTKNHLE